MKTVLFVFAIGILLAVIAGTAVFAEAAPPAPPAVPAQPPTAAPGVPPPASGAPPSAPSIFPRPDSILRPVPSILPTLRLIDAQMAPTLGFVLNLTDDQKTKVLDLLTKSDNDQKPKIEAQAKAAQDYIALLGKSDATQTDLLAAADKVLKAESEIMAVRIGALVALRAILTPEQNKKLSDAVAQPAHRWLPQPGAPPAPPLTPPPSAPAPSTGK